MPIEFTIRAEDAEDFKKQITVLAGLLGSVTQVPGAEAQGSGQRSSPQEPRPVPEPVSSAPAQVTQPEKPVVAPQPEKTKRAHRATTGERGGKTPEKTTQVLAPVSESRPNGQGSEPSVQPLVEEPVEAVGTVEPENPFTVPTTPANLLELKDKIIDQLQAAFRAGKVQQVREFLAKYGNGAKSFREIDVNLFPEIEKAVQGGALN